MENLCPFFKAECHGNQCKMWKDEDCLIVNFLSNFQQYALEEDESSIEEGTRIESAISSNREDAKVPKWLKVATPDEIAQRMLEFKDEEFKNGEEVRFYMLRNLFWSKEGVEQLFLPTEISMKMQQAEVKAQMQMQKEEDEKKKARLSQEREELPNLVSQCVDWARVTGLKRLAMADVDTFALEKDLSFLRETKKAIYSMANVKLKSGRVD